MTLTEAGGLLKENWRDALVSFATGFALACVVISGSSYFDNTPMGEDIQGLTYRLIQRIIHPSHTGPKIQLVDIGSFPQVDGVTPRGELQTLIEAIASQRPLAIGIDIDFSPENNRLVPGDAEFFASCKSICDSQRIPVFLGVHRGIGGDPKEWLGLPLYSPLGATLLTKKDAHHFVAHLGGKENKSSALSMVSKLSWEWAVKDEPNFNRCRPEGPSETKGWLAGSLCSAFTSDSGSANLNENQALTRQSLIDYSKVSGFKAGAITVDTAMIKSGLIGPFLHDQAAKLARAIVLVGDVTNASDLFDDPLGGQDQIPGVLVHAAGVYTAATAPLCEVTEANARCIDLTLTLIGIVLQTLAVLARGKRLSELHFDKLLTWISIVFVVALGLSVNLSRIFWPSFILVVIALIIHVHLVAIYAWGKDDGWPFLRKEIGTYLSKND